MYEKITNQIPEKNILLSEPEMIDQNENLEIPDLHSSWNAHNRKYSLIKTKNDYCIEIEIYDELPEEIKQYETKFKKNITTVNGEQKIIYTFNFPEKQKANEESSQNENYHIQEPLNYKKSAINEFSQEELKNISITPQDINVKKLIEMIDNKRVLFYTGAGISIASGISDMETLKNNLGIDQSKNSDQFLTSSIENPQNTIQKWTEFVDLMKNSEPTQAHKSLSKIAKELHCKIFTENHDILQEKTGVKANHIDAFWLKNNISPDWLKDIDYIITVGLSYDDRGLLSWYKKNNPNGKIVAINLSAPVYAGNDDFIINDDLQNIVPELEKKLTTNNN